MALYAYRCTTPECQADIELFRPAWRRNMLAFCPACQDYSAERALAPPGLVGETVVRLQ